jgi:prepilin-type N-terminal cleavage/methylation domain-containing protein
MPRVSISSSISRLQARAFTLIEVIVASGLLAVAVVAVLGLQGALNRSLADVADRSRAAGLGDAIEVELRRLREMPVPQSQFGRLDALARLISASDGPDPLRLVASRDGTQVIRESDADVPGLGVEPRARFFLVEVRQQPAPLNYAEGAGYLALTLTVSWPYQPAAGPGAAGSSAAAGQERSTLVLNTALTP